MKNFLDHIDGRQLLMVCHLGWPASVVILVLSSFIAGIYAYRFEPREYDRAIRVDLIGQSRPSGTFIEQAGPLPARCNFILGLRGESDRIPRLELRRYSEIMRHERNGPLAVTESSINHAGILRIRVSVALKGDRDPRIVSLIESLNTARRDLRKNFERLLHAAEQRAIIQANGIALLNGMERPSQIGAIVAYLQEEQACTRRELEVTRTRLEALQIPVPYPEIILTSEIGWRAYNFVALIVAALISAILATLLVGYARLLRREAILMPSGYEASESKKYEES